MLEQKYEEIRTDYNKLVNKNKNLRKNNNKFWLKYNELIDANKKLKEQVNSLKHQVNLLNGLFNYQKTVLKQYRNQRLSVQLLASISFIFKLINFLIFKDGKKNSEINKWLSKICGKMTANANSMPIKELWMIYVENWVKNKAQKHLKRRLKKDALNQFIIAQEILDILK